ncbi:MAG: type II toxin-antitoxin system RelE/ParE family toxin [Gammaproteobacteria bacterium]|nr:MAG: type II toxin-antitoxin system RelE/ParE family toxin [Gammaproteobacteria bacterium]
MFEIVYAKSVMKDVRRIAPKNLLKIKRSIEELRNFPDLSQIKHLTDHPIAEYRLRVGNYRILLDVD